MDYVEGKDLAFHLQQQKEKNKIFNKESTKFFLASLILGLEHVHSRNIVHRDIKPSNLLLDDRGYLKVCDFGQSLGWE